MKKKVLIVEDDADVGHLLKQYLEISGFEVSRVFNGEEARNLLSTKNYDILIIDVMMPQEDGFTLAKKLRQTHPALPFLFVTARKMKEDIYEGLQLGADDYIVKPFDVDELVLRLKNILRRTSSTEEAPSASIRIGIYRFEPANLLLISPSGEKTLTEKESRLLEYLNKHRNQLIKRTDILNYLWQEADFFNGRSMDVFISRLRKYLSEDSHIQIESIRGVGFRFHIE